MSTPFCLCPPRVCIPSPVQVLYQVLLTFKVRFPGDSQALCWIPRLGSLWDLELLQQCENFFVIIVLQFGYRLPGGPMFIGTNGDVLQEDLCHTSRLAGLLLSEPLSPWQATADPCLRRRLRNTHRFGSVFCRGHCFFPWFWCGQGFVCDLQASLAGMRYLILNVIVSLLPSCCGFFFALGHSVSFFGVFQYSPLEDCAGAS